MAGIKPNEVYTTEEARYFLKVSESTIKRYLKQGIIKGYEVHGIIRRASAFNTARIDHLYQDTHINGVKLFLHYGDVTDSSSLISLIQKILPDEIYHLAAQSHVLVSFETPEYTANADALGTLRLLEAIRLLGLDK